MIDAAIDIQGVYKIFGAKPQSVINLVKDGMSKQELLDKHGHVLGLQNVNISIPAKGLQVIMGLSGSGKSTLIRHINRLIEPTAGQIMAGGRDILAMNRAELRNFRRFEVSMVFQKFSLLPHRTVTNNVIYGLEIQGCNKVEAAERSQRWIDRVGLTGYESYYPAQLSGGMQQRVGLARALATDADILLMDEPFSALDPLIRTDMQDILLSLQKELHKTIIFITHDLDEALRLGDNIAILRDGIVVQQDSPQKIILSPADNYVAAFTKDINRGRVLEVGSIMDNSQVDNAPQIPKATAIEDALQILIKENREVGQVMDDSKSIGSITMRRMITSLARPNLNNTN